MTTTSPRRDDAPLLGALLRKVRRRVVLRVIEALADAGYGDIREPHMAVLQHPSPRGASPLVLAERAQISKQAMNQLIGTLERAGYVERRAVARGSARRTVWLTARGERAVVVIRRAVRRVERELRAEVGARRFDGMVACLRELARTSGHDG